MTSLGDAVYRDSELPWVGPIPSKWQTVPLISIAVERNEKNGGMLENNLLSLSYGRIVRKDVEANDGLLPESFETYQIVHPGDVVFRLTDLQNDKRSLRTALVEERGIITSAYLAVRAVGVQPNYLGYLLRSYDLSKVFYSMGGGLRQSMKFDDLKRLPLVLPPIDEQPAIAAFLDRETAKIDALVEEQKRLINLLKEKRQAVISHAVTKGLNPDVSMRDSGIEWLGEVPEHWEIRSISSISTKITNGYVGPTRDILVEDGVRYLQSLHIKANRILFESPYFVTEEWSKNHAKSILQRGDVLVVQTGDIGQVAVVTDEFVGCNCHALIIISPLHEVVLGDWLSWVLNSSYGLNSLLAIQTGALHPHLNCGNVKTVVVPVPELEEQALIVDYLKSELPKFDDLILAAEHMTSILHQRRAALISAAVTGKIDVRALVEVEDAA